MSWVRSDSNGALISVHASPRATRSAIAGLHGEALKIRLAAPPVDGKANKELRRFLADALDIPVSSLKILSGETGRSKRVAVTGLTPVQIKAALLPESPKP